MNRFEIDLIRQAFENYQKTGEAIGIIPGKTGDKIFHYSNALEMLIEEEYAIPTSEHYDPDTIDLLAERISYMLTDKGLAYARANFR